MPESTTDKMKTALVGSAGLLMRTEKSPDESLGELFHIVQLAKIFSDGKTFVDLVPKRRARAILKEYQLARQDPNFDLSEFVERHFYEFAPHKLQSLSLTDGRTARAHVSELWPQLKRRNRKNRGSLMALPREYMVPGGRFSEQFYWDTYFIMLGLAADNEWDMIENMMQNFTFMINKFGFIPTASRTYFTSRSQPPFFSHMVRLLAAHKGEKRVYFEYLPYLLAEYRFWMKGRRYLLRHDDSSAYYRAVKLNNGTIANRYFDNKVTPRPESLSEDMETANGFGDEDKNRVFLDLRAAAESGWDFSSRWFHEPNDIRTVYTTDIMPIDLNCLLYDLEQLIADIYKLMKQPILEKKFASLAKKRADAIQEYCWNEKKQYYYDYDFRAGKQTDSLHVAGVFALWSGIASAEQANAVAERLEKEFLRDGGLVTTTIQTGQQWDAPNGWAPLQWVAIQGLRRYGYDELAETIRSRWLESVELVFENKQKMIEKYSVTDTSRVGGGGEYPLQDGFGWTNGVYAALFDEKD
ncbi:MAG TPA: alpha,alpha-trehalase TreF [Candidatus Saccharibacteria bacterium]|nr:alpha,alpha-trehalase TreF [Candidatus Saccharibacteria bacterium]HMR38662.1 alpha,alpha-trehalase TreF [Candidatus Saccharibacteria bacterium]